MSSLPHITKQTFPTEVLNSKTLVIVDFYAPWCGPCKILGPILEDVLLALKDKAIKIVSVNIDEESDLAQQYAIMSVPTIMFFKDGLMVEQWTGVRQKRDFLAKIEELI